MPKIEPKALPGAGRPGPGKAIWDQEHLGHAHLRPSHLGPGHLGAWHLGPDHLGPGHLGIHIWGPSSCLALGTGEGRVACKAAGIAAAIGSSSATGGRRSNAAVGAVPQVVLEAMAGHEGAKEGARWV